MKKSLLFVFVLATILSWQTAKAENLFSKNLYFGIQKDSEVTKLQEFLTSEGVYSGPITGNFFSLTLKAVKDYQAREGISPAAGYFGPISRAKANIGLSTQIEASNAQAVSETGTTPTPSTAPKTTNDVVSTMQSQLDVLLQQVALLQQQLSVQQQIQQTTQNIQFQTIQQQQPQAQQQIQITSVDATSTATSAKIEWQTNLPTNSKIFLSGGGLSSKIYDSESGLSTRHIVNISGLVGGTNYTYEIEAITNGNFSKKTGSFLTQSPPPPTTTPTCFPYSTSSEVIELHNKHRLTQEEISIMPQDIQGMNSSAQYDWFLKTYGCKSQPPSESECGYPNVCP